MSDINVGIQCRLPAFFRSSPVITASTPGDRQRRAGVDLQDLRVRVRAAHDVHVHHVGQLHVVDVAALALDEARVFLALHAVAHAADLVGRGDADLVGGLDPGRGSAGGLVGIGASAWRSSSLRRAWSTGLPSSLRRAQLGGGVLDGLDDLVVARAAAQIAGDAVADLLLRRVRDVAAGSRVRSSACRGCRSRTAGRASPRSPLAAGAVCRPWAQTPRRSRRCRRRPGRRTRCSSSPRGHPAHGTGAAARRVAADVRAGQPRSSRMK